jgi:hypothetical protein
MNKGRLAALLHCVAQPPLPGRVIHDAPLKGQYRMQKLAAIPGPEQLASAT